MRADRCTLQEFLISAGHENEVIARNAQEQTPLAVAVVHSADSPSSAAVAHLLASRFPKSIPLPDENGLDAVR